MSFWLKNIIIALILIGLATAFFLNQNFFLSLNDSSPAIQGEQVEQKVAVTEKASPAKLTHQQKQKNAAAEGLSNFYAKIYSSDDGPKIRNNIIFLPDPQGDLVKILQAREMVVRPYKKNWHGTKISRPFRKGETLYQKLIEYASADGLEVIWWLNKDFIVKDPFRINKDILKTAYQVAEAVSGHFPEGISSFFCYRQKTLVFINEAPLYLKEECTLLKPRRTY